MRVFLFLAVLLSLLVSFLPELGSPLLPIELLSQYRFHFAGFWVVLAFILIAFRYYILAFLELILIVFHIVVFVNSYSLLERERECVVTGEVSVLSFNMYHLNKEYDALFRHIMQVDADIVSLLEHKSGFYHRNHARLSVKYPYNHIELEGGVQQGKAIYSKHPITDVSKEGVRGAPRVILKTKIRKDNQDIDFISIHASSPQNNMRIYERNNQISFLGTYLQGLNMLNSYVIVAGDFNTAPWHPQMRLFKRSTGLRNNARLADIFGTWPSWLPVFATLPIDHIYHSQKFNSAVYYRGVASGSDHYSIHNNMEFCE